MLNQKLYELENWKQVIHTTWNPDGPGVIRMHMVPPKFNPFKITESLVIINGSEILPINESGAILLTEYVKNVNAFGPGPMTDEELDVIIRKTFRGVKKVFPRVKDEVLKEDLFYYVDLFEAVAKGEAVDTDYGSLSISDYARFMTAPHRMDLIVSSMKRDGRWNCNQKCVHCYAADQKCAEEKELTTEEWKSIIHKLRKEKISQLTFTGGEPTMRKDIPELIKEARWFITRLNTNGVNLTKEYCKELREAELDNLQVTFYSCDEDIHNNRKTLEFLHDLGITYVTCSGLILTGNAKGEESEEMRIEGEELYESLRDAVVYAYAHDMEISFTSPGLVSSERLLKMQLNVPSCGACLSNMAVTPSGNVVPCQSWLSDEPLGNILTTKWKKIWNDPRCKKIREISAKEDQICQLR